METLYAYLNWQNGVSLPVAELPTLHTLGVTLVAFLLSACVLECFRVARLGGGGLARLGGGGLAGS
jgi:hypothetical protein